MIPERSETVEFEITTAIKNLDALLIRKVAMCAGLNERELSECGGNLTYKQQFSFDYFYGITVHLKTILELVESGGVVKASVKELKHNKCLIQQVFHCLDAIEKRVT